MGKVLKFKEGTGFAPDNVITLKPWEFRSADWGSRTFIQMLKSQSAKFERHRAEVCGRGSKVSELPPHFMLDGSMAHTIRGMYFYRDNEERMREVYYLAGLIDCMINRVTPLLRTEVIKDIHKKVLTLKSLLNVNWYGSLGQVFLPLDSHLFNEFEYRNKIAAAVSVRELYSFIREETDEMFDILALEYTFYAPGKGA